MKKEEFRTIEGTGRQRVTQTLKSARKDKAMENARSIENRNGWFFGNLFAGWREKRSFPKAENKEDAILAGMAILCGISFTVSFILFFTGTWSRMKYLLLGSLLGIFTVAAIDCRKRSKLLTAVYISGALVTVILIGILAVI